MKVLNQQIIKQNNLKQIFALVCRSTKLSRAELAPKTGLSKTTVSVLVDELIKDGYLVDEGITDTGRQGRKPSMLHVDESHFAIGVMEWCAKEVLLVRISLSGKVMFTGTLPVSEDGDYAAISIEGYNVLLRAMPAGCNMLGICFAIPSSIDPVKASLFSSSLKIKNIETVIQDIRSQIPEIPISFMNDTSCYAYAEKSLTALNMEKSVIYINMSQGVGAIVFSDGKLLGGSNGLKTEFGHVSVDRTGEKCICGNRGCLENLIGESQLLKRAKHVLPEEKWHTFLHLTYKTIGERADAGDESFQLLANLLAEDLAYALGNYITLFNVNSVIIGGKGRSLGAYFYTKLIAHLGHSGFQDFVTRVKVHYSELDEVEQLCGAAKYFTDVHLMFSKDQSGKLFLE